MSDVDADGEDSDQVPKTRVRLRCLVRCTWRIGLWLQLVSSSDLNARVI